MAQPDLIVLPDPVSEKICTKCGQVKVLSEFYTDLTGKVGYRSECKVCCNKANKIWARKNPIKQARYIRKWRKKNPDKCRNLDLKNKYGLTLEEYEKMAAQQKNRCAICGNEPKTKALAVDHCHFSNKIRGLLCGQCNMSLGGFRDNPRLLQAAIIYLELRG